MQFAATNQRNLKQTTQNNNNSSMSSGISIFNLPGSNAIHGALFGNIIDHQIGLYQRERAPFNLSSTTAVGAANHQIAMNLASRSRKQFVFQEVS